MPTRHDRSAGAGVFVAITAVEFGDLLAKSPDAGSVFEFAARGGALAVASGRVSYSLGLQGPCSTVNTACSSSLVATHGAVSALALGECTLGLCAAVNLMLTPACTTSLAVSGFTSQLGRCFTFDRRGDGYARSEACGGVAIRSSHELPGPELRASAVRQDGRSASLTAPNGLAQQALLRAVLRVSSTSSEGLVCLEAHGTGTALGDPVEVRSFVEVISTPGCPYQTHTALSSSKASAGHGEPVAGMVGLLRMKLQLEHMQRAPNVHLRQVHQKCSVLHGTPPRFAASHRTPPHLSLPRITPHCTSLPPFTVCLHCPFTLTASH